VGGVSASLFERSLREMLGVGTGGRRQACESGRDREREAKERNVERNPGIKYLFSVVLRCGG